MDGLKQFFCYLQYVIYCLPKKVNPFTPTIKISKFFSMSIGIMKLFEKKYIFLNMHKILYRQRHSIDRCRPIKKVSKNAKKILLEFYGV